MDSLIHPFLFSKRKRKNPDEARWKSFYFNQSDLLQVETRPMSSPRRVCRDFSSSVNRSFIIQASNRSTGAQKCTPMYWQRLARAAGKAGAAAGTGTWQGGTAGIQAGKGNNNGTKAAGRKVEIAKGIQQQDVHTYGKRCTGIR